MAHVAQRSFIVEVDDNVINTNIIILTKKLFLFIRGKLGSQLHRALMKTASFPS